MMSVDNRLRMIRLIEKIERNRKLADKMHVSNRSILKSVDRKQTQNTKGEKRRTTMENKVLATVAGEEITEAEFEAFLQNFQDLGVQIIEKNVTIEEYEDYFLAKGCVKAICRTGTDIPINRKEEITVNEHN